VEASTERLSPDIKNRIWIDGSNRHRADNVSVNGDLLPQPIQRKSQHQTCSRATLSDSQRGSGYKASALPEKQQKTKKEAKT